MEDKKKELIKSALEKAMNFEDYLNLVESDLEKGKATGGQTDELFMKFSKLNLSRMKRIRKTAVLNDSLVEQVKKIAQNQIWLVITEGWCGDAAQSVPFLERLAEYNDNVNLKLVLRDQNIDLMQYYLTNGGMSIPKLVIINAQTLDEINSWGPRPQELQKIVEDYRDTPENERIPYDKFLEESQLWYLKDKFQGLNNELEELLKQ